MKIAIIGSGGVGGYFGGRLAQNGHDVTFLARENHLQAILKNGLQVKSISGDFVIKPVKATDDILKIGVVDLVVLGLKAWQVKEIAKNLQSIITPKTIVIPLQNGVMAAEELATEIDPKNIVGGLCRIISKIESPGVINHFGLEPTVILGEVSGGRSIRVEEICNFFLAAGINARQTDNYMKDLWNKFTGICVSGLLAVTRSNYGEVRALKETRDIITALLTEIYLVASKAGVNLNSDIVDKTLDAIDAYPYDSTSSLTRDVWEGKPSEIEYQNGTVVKLGTKYGVPTPANQFIYNCILPMEKRARKAYNE